MIIPDPVPPPSCAPATGPDPVLETAFEVSEYLLEITRRAYMDRDEAAFVARFALPQVVSTFDGTRTMHTPEEVAEAFHKMCAYFTRMGVVDLKRQTVAARFVDPTCVEATYVSRHVTGADTLGPENVTHGFLRCTNGLWQVAEGHYATGTSHVSEVLLRR